jgi:hypothetical protein
MNKTKNGGTRTNNKAARGAPPPGVAPGAARDAEVPLPSQEDVQARFDLAVQEGVSPCLWIPPKWQQLRPLIGQPKKFPDNTSDPNGFVGKNDEEEEEIRVAIQERLKAGKAIKVVQRAEDPPSEKTWPSPFADTSHIDETEFTAAELALVNQKLGNPVLDRLHQIVGPEAPGMARLKRIFEWALHRASVLMSDLNRGLKHRAAYEKARENYIHFLRDIDDHEPEKGPKTSPREREAGELGRPTKLDPRNKLLASGYGRSLKWTCIDPVIFDGKIVGTRVVVKWNPHISSSGIPINH